MSIPQLIREARLAQQLDLDALSRKTGVAKNHLVDIEAGKGSSFHTVLYCRRAVMTVAQALNIQEQAESLWRDEDWQTPTIPARLAGLGDSSGPLLPGPDRESEASRRGLIVAGAVGLLFVAVLALNRIDRDEPPARSQTPGGMSAGQDASPSAATSAVQPPSGSAVSAGPNIESATALRSEVERGMQEWARLWRSRSIEAYVALYAAEFPGIQEHLGARRARMAQASFIEVELSELSYRETGPSEITVRFRQTYRADAYRSDDVKEMVWRRTSQGLRIWSERLVN